MRPLAKIVAVTSLAGFSTALMVHTASAEPLLTVLGFAQAAYNDSASNEVVVKLVRVDQDPATQAEAFSLDCAVTGGTAVENVDYRLSFNGSMSGLGTVTFPPGVPEQTFTIYTMKNAGPSKTLQIGCANPTGPAPVVTGDSPTARITIVNAP